jgi:hypothetical protein
MSHNPMGLQGLLVNSFVFNLMLSIRIVTNAPLTILDYNSLFIVLLLLPSVYLQFTVHELGLLALLSFTSPLVPASNCRHSPF